MGEALPTGTAHLLPGRPRGRAGCCPGLCAWAVLCLDIVRQRRQALLGWLQGPFGWPQTTGDGPRIARGPVPKHPPPPWYTRCGHGPADRADLARGEAFLLPGGGGLEQERRQNVQDVAPGTGRAPHR
jgi:hypothetical protein